MPNDWCNGTIDDLAKDIVCGKTPSTKKADYYGTDIPFITIPDMHDKIYSITTERHLSLLGANSQAKKNLPKNSICVSCIGTAGLVTLVAEESQTNQQINSIIPKDGFSPYFIYLLMQTRSDTINKLGQGGSTIVNLNKSQFAKIQVTIPAISAMTDYDKIEENERINNNLPPHPCNAWIAAKQRRQTPKTDEYLYTDGKVSDRGSNEETAEQFSSLLAA